MSLRVFLSVGTQFPFDRLVRACDEWAGANQATLMAQICDGEYQPKNGQWAKTLNPDEYQQALDEADILVSHAGMGSIISALENQKPIIVMNRQFELGEHRNNHQLDGMSWMGDITGVSTAYSTEELHCLLDQYESLPKPSESDASGRKMLADFLTKTISAWP